VIPRTKVLKGLSEDDAQRARDALDCRMKEILQKSWSPTIGAATDAPTDDPASRISVGINNTRRRALTIDDFHRGSHGEAL